IAVGTTQRLGCPMGFGGPSAGYMATKEAFKRNMPGRIIGVSVDRLGRRALRMSLQMREQHIKRERATSNICTASALMASIVGFHCVYNGAEGLRRAALTAHLSALSAAKGIEALGYKVSCADFFDTLDIEAEASVVESVAEEHHINFYYPSEFRVRISFDDVTTSAEVEEVVAIFAEAKGKKTKRVHHVTEPQHFMERKSAYLTEPIFNRYRSESELMRYIKQLELRDISLANSMISLGSCTMKLNAAALMQPLSLSGFQNIHPFAPANQREGYTEMIETLERDLATITGFAACSVQPNSGAAGEYSGLMVIRAYHQSRNQGYRNIVLIPASAHGTNPASAAMAGMRIVTVACDAQGNIDVDDLKAKAEQYSSELCALMVTYPSTHGVFESRIREIVDTIHDAGGEVYMDGANMNAQVGLTNPGFIGADVCHLNLHKTFAMPHGGGGPGVGPICVASHLAPFLPSHSVVATGGDEGITAVSSSPWGSAMLLPITYGYIKMLGEEGLRKATE
ncbi:MAG: glycine dehydrogenase (aminomethyl-transferring), partial [Alistipes sp.]|nr:glycine dehydrogenase (aminomethyl-transferring) [Alistipes sp.]